MSASCTRSDAIAFASGAHTGQTDKAGHPYIEHPLRVTRRLHGEHEQMAAVLHEVLEDTSTTVEALRSVGYPEPVITAVLALTKHRGESLEHAMARAADPIARAVKRANIADNSAPERLALLDLATAQRLRRKYADSTQLLDHPVNSGTANGH
jgi:(p)ppGpp synthase/HD superfamily hydrolase